MCRITSAHGAGVLLLGGAGEELSQSLGETWGLHMSGFAQVC